MRRGSWARAAPRTARRDSRARHAPRPQVVANSGADSPSSMGSEARLGARAACNHPIEGSVVVVGRRPRPWGAADPTRWKRGEGGVKRSNDQTEEGRRAWARRDTRARAAQTTARHPRRHTTPESDAAHPPPCVLRRARRRRRGSRGARVVEQKHRIWEVAFGGAATEAAAWMPAVNAARARAPGEGGGGGVRRGAGRRRRSSATPRP